MKSVNVKYLVTLFLSIALALSISACGTAAATQAPASSDTATQASGDTAAPAAGDVVAAFVFTNSGTVEICELYLSPVGTDAWGPDQLKSQTIAVGGKFTLTNIPAGPYDAKVVGCNGAGESVSQIDIKN